MEKYDLIVVGGGFAGVSAAVTAAKEGCHVLIVEKGNSFGGAAINCLVNPFMYYSTKINGVQTELSQGIFKTICQKLKERGALEYNAFLEEELKFILNDCKKDLKLISQQPFDSRKKVSKVTIKLKDGKNFGIVEPEM